MTAAIRTEGLTKRFGALAAVDGLGLEVPSGTVAGFLGPNGAGKTTTLRMLTGLVRPSAGSFTLEGTRADLGALVDRPSFYPYLSGLSNLTALARLKGIPDPASAALEVLGGVGLATAQGAQLAGAYSTGMLARLGIAFALLGRPRLIILDEPTSGLDPEGRRLILDLLADRCASRGTSLFVSSHLLWEVERIASWVAVIHKGRLLRQGPIRELMAATAALRPVQVRAEPLEAVGALCRERGWAHEVQGAKVSVSIEGEVVPELVSRLVAAGARVYSVAEEKASLEELYLELTAAPAGEGDG